MTVSKVRATMHGAVSIVNAIATGNGSALGISLKVTAEVEMTKGRGLRFLTGKNDDRLVNNIIKNTMPAGTLERNQLIVKLRSEIPIGFGLKSSSAVSNAVALACSRLANEKVDDYAVLDAAVRASLDAKVTITGAYDDATACYFGGFVVTDNYAKKLLRREEAPDNLHAVIFLPRNTPRGDVHKLSDLSDLFTDAFGLAEAGEYWKAMKLNGVLASTALGANYKPVLAALEQGALAAGMSGNGPSIAAVAYDDEVEDIKNAFLKFNGRVLVSKVNNQKASVEVL
ncbi:shikimate kinase [Candidatus Nitrososphaera evergladensis SR1]|jgi:shikimate kinase|uniref:Shikimate kinase n=1 Tax=Candidatus Nitrososphaera evergladensis SR1 TaxID=1459636 RepID=A0A075MR33_9ARCH|nr:shikimate kinase [Candidatus Nitrososphaera evergladensis]AIF84011.1 shikimate kinase [Candidatus Nitrososphaera evergladensis SR1]